jgi:hypothetical protein
MRLHYVHGSLVGGHNATPKVLLLSPRISLDFSWLARAIPSSAPSQNVPRVMHEEQPGYKEQPQPSRQLVRQFGVHASGAQNFE